MPFSLLPKQMVSSLTDVTAESLLKKGIRLLMLDFDNTIVPYTTSAPTEEMAQWLENITESEILVCVVSNSKRDRVKIFCRKYGIPCITHAKKPFQKGIQACLAKFGIPAHQAAIAGDQIYTDTLGGNCAGVYTILVEAINNHNFWLKARHVLELPFIYLARRKS